MTLRIRKPLGRVTIWHHFKSTTVGARSTTNCRNFCISEALWPKDNENSAQYPSIQTTIPHFHFLPSRRENTLVQRYYLITCTRYVMRPPHGCILTRESRLSAAYFEIRDAQTVTTSRLWFRTCLIDSRISGARQYHHWKRDYSEITSIIHTSGQRKA